VRVVLVVLDCNLALVVQQLIMEVAVAVAGNILLLEQVELVVVEQAEVQHLQTELQVPQTQVVGVGVLVLQVHQLLQAQAAQVL
jgi:hypothetical protein